MGKLGVREKSQIHILTKPTAPIPGFGTSFLPFTVSEVEDDRGDNFPQPTNFARSATTANVTNIYAFPSTDTEDGEQGVPGGVGNFGGSTGGGTTNNYVTNNYIAQAQEPDDAEPGVPWTTFGIPLGGVPYHLGPGCDFISAGLSLPLAGTLVSECWMPYNGSVTGWTITGDLAGSASILVEHATYANYDTMSSLFTATCTTAKKAQSLGIGPYTFSRGDVLRFTGSGFATFTRCEIVLDTAPS